MKLTHYRRGRPPRDRDDCVKTSIRVDAALWTELKAHAVITGTTLDAIIEESLKDYLEKKIKK